jgi:hypothetical protein
MCGQWWFPIRGVISFEIEGRFEQFFCTLDSRTEPIDNSVQLAVKKSSFTIGLIRLPDHHFLETLRTKTDVGGRCGGNSFRFAVQRHGLMVCLPLSSTKICVLSR